MIGRDCNSTVSTVYDIPEFTRGYFKINTYDCKLVVY